MNDALFETVASRGTPAYLFDLDDLADRAAGVRAALPDGISLCFAMKANPHLTAAFADCVDFFEVCSPGEFRICERAAIPMERVVLSGVYKNADDITAVMSRYDVGVYTAESEAQVALLEAAAKACGKTPRVLLRLSSGNQFGMDEQTLCAVLKNRDAAPHLRFAGIHFYSGTQKKRLSQITRELARLDDLCDTWQTLCGQPPSLLEYGPGCAVSYFEEDDPDEQAAWFAGFADALSGMRYKGAVTLEFGRYLTALCGVYLTRIADRKKTDGIAYLICDGGIHHLNYYGQSMGMKRPPCTQLPPRSGETEQVVLCGALCTTADVICKDLPLCAPQIGDLLCFRKAGAYSVTEGSYLFLSRDLPKIWFCSEADGLILHRDSLRTDEWNF